MTAHCAYGSAFSTGQLISHCKKCYVCWYCKYGGAYVWYPSRVRGFTTKQLANNVSIPNSGSRRLWTFSLKFPFRGCARGLIIIQEKCRYRNECYNESLIKLAQSFRIASCQGGAKLSGKAPAASMNHIVLTRFPCEYE